MKKKILAGVLAAVLVVGGVTGGGYYYKNTHQPTVSVVSVDSIASDYYSDDTMLEGDITSSAQQNISVDKDMIIQELHVSAGDNVKKGDELITYDMTLVQMELNIAKLELEQIEQNLTRAENRLKELNNGAAVKDSDAVSVSTADNLSGNDDTRGDDTSSGDDLTASLDQVNGSYLASVFRSVLAADVVDFFDGSTEESSEDSSDENSGESSQQEAEDENPFTDGDDSEPSSTPTPVPEITQTETAESGDISFADGNIEEDNTDGVTDPNAEGFTDGDPEFYQTLDGDTLPFTGSGTKDDPYIYLCSSAKGYVVIRGSFFNKMAGIRADGTKGKSSWYQLEFHTNDTVTDFLDRKDSCSGYYLVDGKYLPDGSELKNRLTDTAEVELSLDGASHYDDDDDDGGGDDGGGDAGGDDASTTVSRKDAIKNWENQVESLKIDVRKKNLEISKLEKKVAKEVVYSKLDGVVSSVGDPVTGEYTGDYFMVVKSSEGYYVQGSVSELMLDQLTEGTELKCSGDGMEFVATVIDVSEYPVDSDSASYYGTGNPNVSYYSYTASIDDKTLEFTDYSWITVSLQGQRDENGIVLDKAFVRSENGTSYVYIDDNGVLKKQTLTVGGNVNYGYSVLIKGGLSRDDLIAFPYGDDVKDGTKTKEVSVNDFYGY